MPPSGVDASPKPSPPRPMVDFCSGASFAALNEGKIIQSRIHGPKLVTDKVKILDRTRTDNFEILGPDQVVRVSFTLP